MKTDVQPKMALHFFVCCNERESKDDCAAKGGKKVRDELKKWTKEQGLSPYLRINQAGCLGRCAEGIATVAYPQGEWNVEVKPDDLFTLKRKIEEWVVGAVLSPEQIVQFETGMLVTLEPLSRVKSIVKSRLSRVGKIFPMVNEDGKVLFQATLSQAEVVKFGELPPVVLELLGYQANDADDKARFERDYRIFWQKYFSDESLTDQSDLWVCVWRKE